MCCSVSVILLLKRHEIHCFLALEHKTSLNVLVYLLRLDLFSDLSFYLSGLLAVVIIVYIDYRIVLWQLPFNTCHQRHSRTHGYKHHCGKYSGAGKSHRVALHAVDHTRKRGKVLCFIIVALFLFKQLEHCDYSRKEQAICAQNNKDHCRKHHGDVFAKVGNKEGKSVAGKNEQKAHDCHEQLGLRLLFSFLRARKQFDWVRKVQLSYGEKICCKKCHGYHDNSVDHGLHGNVITDVHRIVTEHLRKYNVHYPFKDESGDTACDEGYHCNIYRFKEHQLCDMSFFHSQNVQKTELFISPF